MSLYAKEDMQDVAAFLLAMYRAARTEGASEREAAILVSAWLAARRIAKAE